MSVAAAAPESRGLPRSIVLRPAALPVSFRLYLRVPGVLLALSLVTLAGMVVNVGVGEFPIAPLDVVRTLLGAGNPEYDLIVWTLRVPRMLVAFMVGVGLATSGGILQGLTRNPLAAPEILGVTQGASLGAVAVIVGFAGIPVPGLPRGASAGLSVPLAFLPAAALAGAVLAGGVTYSLAWKRGSSSPIRLILVGIGVAAICQALVNLAISSTLSVNTVANLMLWLAGTVYGLGWERLWPLLPWLAVFVPLALVLSRHLNALNLGDEVARGLGSRVERQRLVLLVTSVALAAASVATAGPVSFVGLMAPHIARGLVGPLHGGLLPTAAMVGGMLVVLADLAGRTLFAPIEVPAGVVTGVIGAPYLVYLLYRGRNV